MLPAIALALAFLVAQAGTTTASPNDAPSAQFAAVPSAPPKPPCRNPDSSGKFHVGCGVTAPQLIYKVDTEIPKAPKGIRLLTTVPVTFSLDVDGHPQDVQIRNSQVDKVDKVARALQQQFETNLVNAVKQYNFKPATFQGKPVPVDINLEVNIDLF